MNTGATLEWNRFGAVLFDLDGVLTPTAEVHERAWCELFAAQGCTHEDYLALIDGRPRYDGVRTFLRSRSIELPDGSPDDPPGDHTVCALGNRKNEIFNELLAREGVVPYAGSVRVLDHLAQLSIPMAVVSSSNNATAVVRAAGLADRFTVIVDGALASRAGLAGKPAPDTFIHASALLDVPISTTVVVEDARSGVAAARAGGFAFVIGVDRGGQRSALLEAGADLVVDDLGDTLASGHEDGVRDSR